jgi:hypothetical protein
MADDLCKLIKENRSLKLLDLSYSRLNELVVRRILRALRKAISLQSIHLSGNPGLVELDEAKVKKIAQI